MCNPVLNYILLLKYDYSFGNWILNIVERQNKNVEVDTNILAYIRHTPTPQLKMKPRMFEDGSLDTFSSGSSHLPATKGALLLITP